MGFPIAAVTLPGNGDTQVFVGGTVRGALTLTQTGGSSTDGLDSAWSGSTPFSMSTQSNVNDYNCIAACADNDGRANLWALPTVGSTFTARQKASASAQWSQPSAFSPQPPSTSASGPIRQIAAGKSVPGRIQLFAALPNQAAGNCTMVTTWETEENSGVYYDWIPMEGAPTLSLFPAIACVNTPDGLLQLWATNAQGELTTTWKSGREINAPWGAWQQTGVKASCITGGVDSSGQVDMWACDGQGSTVLFGYVTSPPSATVSWRNLEIATGAEVGTIYNLAAHRLSSGHLIVFAAAAQYNKPDSYELYATLSGQNETSAWVALASLS